MVTMRVVVLPLLILQITKVTLGNNIDDVQLTARVAAMELNIRNQGETIRDLHTQVRDLKQQVAEEAVADVKVPFSRGTRAHPIVNVAFSAYIDHVVHNIGIDSIVPFNKLVINDGGAFNNVTSIFTVPITGVYLFTYTVNTYFSARQLVVKLVVDGVNVSDGISDPFHDYQEIQGGNTVLVRVQQGQSVWLAAYNTGNTLLDGRETHRFSTLSGVLLYT